MLLPKRHHIPLTPDERDYIRANLSLAADGSIVWSVTRGKATKGSRADRLNTNGMVQVKTGRGYRSAKVVRHFLETGRDLYADWEPTTSDAVRSKRAAYVAKNYTRVLTEQRAARARTRAVVAPILAQARAHATAALEAARQERREVLEDLRRLRRILAQDSKDGRRLARRAQRKAELERLRVEKLADPVYQAERERRRRELQRLANERRKALRHALRPPRVPMTPVEARPKRLEQIAEWTRKATAAFRASFVGPPTRQSAMRTWRLEHPSEPYPVGWLSERRKVRSASACPRPAKAPGDATAPRRTTGTPRSPEARLEAAKARREAREVVAAGRAWDKAAAALVACIRKAWRKAATPAQRTAAQLAADARKREERERQLDAARQRGAELRASLEATRAAQATRRQAEGLAPITHQRDRRPEGRSFLVKADAEQARLTAMPSQTASADAAADRASLIARANADVLALALPRRRPV